MANRKGIHYWVKRVTSARDAGWNLWGNPLTPHHGFEDPLDREFEGSVCLIGAGERRTQDRAAIGLGHANRSGFFLRLEAGTSFQPLDAPFLVTSNLEARLLFQGEVSLRPFPIMQLVINDQEVEEEYLVGCADWMGVLRVPPPHRGLFGRLIAFSGRSGAAIEGQELLHLDRDDEVFGSVSPRG
jgi:hypothetical protein